MSASTTNQMLPAEVTPAIAASPSFDTKYRSVKKYSVCTRMPMAIWIDIEAMCPGIEPELRSFMWELDEPGGRLNDRLDAGSSTPRTKRPVSGTGLLVIAAMEPYLPQGIVVMMPIRPRGSLLPTSPVILVPLLSLPSVPVNLANTVKLPNV